MNWHTHVVWAATCRNFLSQHFTCKNSLELNSYMQNGSEFEEAKTWVGRDATSKKKDTASREDRQFTVHERYQWGGKSHWVDFLKFIVVKEKKNHFWACLQNERSTVPWENTAEAAGRNIPDPGERQNYSSFTSQNTWILCYNTSTALLPKLRLQVAKSKQPAQAITVLWRVQELGNCNYPCNNSVLKHALVGQLWPSKDFERSTIWAAVSRMDYCLFIPNSFSSPLPTSTSCAPSSLWFQHFLQSCLAQVLFEAVLKISQEHSTDKTQYFNTLLF